MIYVAEKDRKYAEARVCGRSRKQKVWSRYLIQCFWVDLKGELPRTTIELIVDVIRISDVVKYFIKHIACSIRSTYNFR
jgi:hypothetical protein